VSTKYSLLFSPLDTSEINIPVAQSTAVSSVNAALEAAEVIRYPVILRSAFTLGGLGSGFAENADELRDLAAKGLSLSPQVLIERSMKGWKELEYEVVRDGADVGLHFPSNHYLFRCLTCLLRIPLSAVTWRTSIPSVPILVIQLWLLLHRPYPMMNTTCYGVLQSKSSDISA
jgi:biotin carboxylase